MKHKKRPTRAQKDTLRRFGFNPMDWLICKDSADGLTVECRYTGQHRTIPGRFVAAAAV